MDKLVNITIATYNRVECTKQCIESLFARTNHPFVLNIIDNGSSDQTREYLNFLMADAAFSAKIGSVIFLEKNMGISCAYNLGWRLSDTPYYMKVDNDVLFLRDDWLNQLIHYADSIPDAAMIGFGRNTSGVTHPQDSNLYFHGHVGGCTLIPRKAHEAIGFWNEDYGLYGEEDADFGIRARLAGMICFSIDDGKGPFTRYIDGIDDNYSDYMSWKKVQREENLQEIMHFNDTMFKCSLRPHYVETKYVPNVDGQTCSFSVNRDYIMKFEALYKRYGPIYRQIIESEEFQTINKDLGFNFFY